MCVLFLLDLIEVKLFVRGNVGPKMKKVKKKNLSSILAHIGPKFGKLKIPSECWS